MGYPYSAQPVLVSGENIKTIGGESVLGSGDIAAVSSTDLQAALTQYFVDAYSRTTDPGVEGQVWNDQGILMFSSGGVVAPSLNFSIATNSQYLGTLA